MADSPGQTPRRPAWKRSAGALLGLLRSGSTVRSTARGCPLTLGFADKGGIALGIDLVDDAIGLGLLGRHEVVAIRIPGDLLLVLAGVPGQDPVQALGQLLQLPDLDEHVRGVAPESRRTLMDHDPAVGQRVPLAG